MSVNPTILPEKLSVLPLLFFIILGLGSAKISAQEATTTINLILSDVILIEPSSEAKGGSVNFYYENENDYHSKKTSSVPNSLIITNSKPFDLKVKANGENFENGSDYIPVNVLTIKQSENSQVNGTASPVVLSAENQTLINDVGPSSQLNIDLDYIIPKAKSSSTDILGKPEGTYTQKVTYTVSAL